MEYSFSHPVSHQSFKKVFIMAEETIAQKRPKTEASSSSESSGVPGVKTTDGLAWDLGNDKFLRVKVSQFNKPPTVATNAVLPRLCLSSFALVESLWLLDRDLMPLTSPGIQRQDIR